MPELIAPTELYAYPGRGGALVYALDDDGKRIPEDENKAPDPVVQKRRKKKHRRAGGAMGGAMGGARGGRRKKKIVGPRADPVADAKKAAKQEQEKINRQLVGKANDKEEEKDDDDDADGKFKEITKGLRWVSIIGVLDHEKMKANYLTALKNPAVANPNYKQLAVERQVLQPDGEWSEWEKLDEEKNHLITYNLPEEEEEMTPDDVRIGTLVEPLPFLKAGFWERVHVARLVPKEKREVKEPVAPAGGGMMGGPMGGGSEMMAGAGSMSRPGGASGGKMMMPPMGNSEMMGGGMMMGGPAATAVRGAEENCQTSRRARPRTIMIRGWSKPSPSTPTRRIGSASGSSSSTRTTSARTSLLAWM